VIDGLCLSDGPFVQMSPKLLEEYMFRSLAECGKRIDLSRIAKQADQRLTQAGFFLAFRRPGFFLSTRLASDVTVPATRLISNRY
jgi:hypothetical protein